MPFTNYGPGDFETCGPCTGYVNDPRTPEPCDCGECDDCDAEIEAFVRDSA